MNIKEFITNNLVENDWILNGKEECSNAFNNWDRYHIGPQPRYELNYKVRTEIVTGIHLNVNKISFLNEMNHQIKDTLKYHYARQLG